MADVCQQSVKYNTYMAFGPKIERRRKKVSQAQVKLG